MIAPVGSGCAHCGEWVNSDEAIGMMMALRSGERKSRVWCDEVCYEAWAGPSGMPLPDAIKEST